MTLSFRIVGGILIPALLSTIGPVAVAQNATPPKASAHSEPTQISDIDAVKRALKLNPDLIELTDDSLNAIKSAQPNAFPGDLFEGEVEDAGRPTAFPGDLFDKELEGVDQPSAFPGDLFGHDETKADQSTAFPGDLFSVDETLHIQTEYLLGRAKAGKPVRAVHDMSSQYREDVAVLGERLSQAAAVSKETDPKQAKLYADLARTLRSSLFTPVAREDKTATVNWLDTVQRVHDELSELQKTSAR